MKVFKLIVLLAMVMIIQSCNIETQEIKYKRTDCIIKINIMWKDSKMNLQEKFNEIFPYEIHKIFNNEQNVSMPAIATPEPLDAAYFQFKNDCDRKYKMANKIVDKLNVEFEHDFYFSISNEKVIPSINTIDISGDSWVD